MTKCETCEHREGERCHQTNRGLTAGWPREGGLYSPNVSLKGAVLECPRHAVVANAEGDTGHP